MSDGMKCLQGLCNVLYLFLKQFVSFTEIKYKYVESLWGDLTLTPGLTVQYHILLLIVSTKMSTPPDPDKEPDVQPSSSKAPAPAASSSKPKTRILKSYVHQEFIEVATRDLSKKHRSLVWTSQCRHCDRILKNKLPETLKVHLKQHPEVLNKVLYLDEQNQIKHRDEDKVKNCSKVEMN